MAQAGRPKKPSAIKKLEGTYREDREIENEMMPSRIEFAPSPPALLSKFAKKEWKSVCAELISLNMLHSVDLGLLAAYCSEMSYYYEAIEEISENGSVNAMPREDGSIYYQQSPWVSIRNSALKNAQSLANQFGFTPAARSRIKGESKGKEVDPFDATMKMA